MIRLRFGCLVIFVFSLGTVAAWAGPAAWTGQRPFGGRVNRVTADPNMSSRLYAETGNGFSAVLMATALARRDQCRGQPHRNDMVFASCCGPVRQLSLGGGKFHFVRQWPRQQRHAVQRRL